MHSNHVATQPCFAFRTREPVASTRCTQTTLLRKSLEQRRCSLWLHLRDALKPRCYVRENSKPARSEVASTRCTQTTLLPSHASLAAHPGSLHLRDALKPRCYGQVPQLHRRRNMLHLRDALKPRCYNYQPTAELL